MKLSLRNGEWIIGDGPDSLYLDGLLKEKLDLIKRRIRNKWDCVILIDGEERSGKSTLGMTIGTYLSNGKFNASNIASGISDCAKKIKEIKPSTKEEISILMVDEGSLVFNSKDAMVSAQKSLMKVLDVVGQKNIVFIIILPSFFDLNKTIALRRSRFLLHVYPDPKTGHRGKFCYFSKKQKPKLYYEGKKAYGSYLAIRPKFRAQFTDYRPAWYEEYLKIKDKSLLEALDTATESKPINPKNIETELMVKMRANNPKLTHELIYQGLGLSKTAYFRRLQTYLKGKSATVPPSITISQDQTDDFEKDGGN